MLFVKNEPLTLGLRKGPALDLSKRMNRINIVTDAPEINLPLFLETTGRNIGACKTKVGSC